MQEKMELYRKEACRIVESKMERKSASAHKKALSVRTERAFCRPKFNFNLSEIH